MVVAGVFLVARLYPVFHVGLEINLAGQDLNLIALIGGITIVIAALLAFVQNDIKRVLAYSTVSQLGYMMMGLGVGAWTPAVFHIFTHAFFKCCLFLCAGSVSHTASHHSFDMKTDMGGIWRKMPVTFVTWMMSTAALIGIPFFAGFFSKEEILGATWAGGLTVPFGMLVLAAFLTAFYMFRVVFIAFLGGPAAAPAGHGAHGEGHAHDAPAIMTLPLWILAALAMGIGIGFTIWHPQEAEFEAPHWLTALAVAVAVAGIVFAWLVYGLRAIGADRLYARLAWIGEAAVERFWLDDLFALVYRRVILGASRTIGWVDRYIVDGILNVLSAWTLTAGDRLRRIQSGQAQDYVYGIALGVLLLMVWMRWPR
jgi:NADH-quinone oxidoreductase subunit L